MTATVLYDQHDQIVTITLNRPDALNAINRQLRQELAEAILPARRLCANAPLSLRCFKELAHRGLEMNETGVAALTRHLYDQLLLSEDAKEGPRAFAEKRAPKWQGR